MLMTIALHAASCLDCARRATMTGFASTGEFFAHLCRLRRRFRGSLRIPASELRSTNHDHGYDPTDRSQEALANLIRERFGELVLPGEFLICASWERRASARKRYQYEPGTDRAAYNRVLASANGVHQAIEGHIRQVWGEGGAHRTSDLPRRPAMSASKSRISSLAQAVKDRIADPEREESAAPEAQRPVGAGVHKPAAALSDERDVARPHHAP